MIDLYHITVILISFGAGILSGLLGLGGGIIVFPAFFYLMPFLGFKTFTVSEITGIAATQSLAGIFFAYLNHRKFDTINVKLIKSVIFVAIIGALLGGIAAKFISEVILLWFYLFLLVVAVIIILAPRLETCESKQECTFNRPILINIFIFVSMLIASALGFAGALTFIPVFNHFCNAGIKVAISTGTLAALITTAFVFAGKAAVGLVYFDLLPLILIGAFLGAGFGAWMNKKLSPTILKTLLIVMALIVGIRIFLTILEY